MLGEAHDFSLPRLGGGTFTLSAHRGEVVILNFWATWCAPCIVEVPELVALQAELAPRGVLVVGVSQDTGPDAYGDVRDFAERLEVNYPVVLDTALRVSHTYGVHALPTTLVVDREGQIRARTVGLVHREDVLEMLAGVLEPEPAAERAPGAVPAPAEPDLRREGGEPADVAALSAYEAGLLFDAGFMVIDLRPVEQRALEGHIPYAMTVSLEALEPSALPANFGAPILFIASDDEAAWRAAARAASWGYASVHPVIGGFEAWRAAGLPVERRAPHSQRG